MLQRPGKVRGGDQYSERSSGSCRTLRPSSGNRPQPHVSRERIPRPRLLRFIGQVLPRDSGSAGNPIFATRLGGSVLQRRTTCARLGQRAGSGEGGGTV